jgi:hypothetical protein
MLFSNLPVRIKNRAGIVDVSLQQLMLRGFWPARIVDPGQIHGLIQNQNQEQKQVRGKPHLLLIKPILTDRAIKNRNTKKEEK